ncbi:3D domain-containing protein [Rummeliibacillus sp. JY-2-4R]
MSKNPMENENLKSKRYQKKKRNFATFMLPFAVATSAVLGTAIYTVSASANDVHNESRINDFVSSHISIEKLAGETSTTVADFLKQPTVESGENSDLQKNNDTQKANDTKASGVRVEKAIDVVEESRDSENKNSGKEITQVSQPRTYHTTANLNLRKGPGTKYGVKITIPRGKNVTYKGKKGNWYKVSYKGKIGYVSKTYLRSGSIKKVSNSLNGKSMYVSSTAYTANCNGCSGKTSIGINLRKDPYKKVIAVDPRVIPLRKMVYVEGYGLAIAGDTGGAIKGHKIDVFMPTKKKALNWGRRTIKVTIQK